jgi:hypothetical protein
VPYPGGGPRAVACDGLPRRQHRSPGVERSAGGELAAPGDSRVSALREGLRILPPSIRRAVSIKNCLCTVPLVLTGNSVRRQQLLESVQAVLDRH